MERRIVLNRARTAGLLLPMLVFLSAFFFYPAVRLLGFSVLTQNASGVVGLPVTASHYDHFFLGSLYLKVLWTTLRLALVTAVLAAMLAYPVALVMVRRGPAVARAITLIVIAPLIVSVVVRVYGWQLVLGNGPNGVLNYILLSLHLVSAPVSLLYTDTAVVIASLHVFFAMMVLPLASAIGKIEHDLENAAATLGAPWWWIFWRVTFPLSLPGLVAGFTLVFSLTAGSYVIPALLGGTTAQFLGNLIQQQILTVFDWPFGAAIATVLTVIVLGVNLAAMRVLGRWNRAGFAR